MKYRLIANLYLCLFNKETERLVADPAPGIVATPHEDNLRYFDVVVSGPSQSPFEGEMSESKGNHHIYSERSDIPSLFTELQVVHLNSNFSCQKNTQWPHLKCAF